MFSHWTSLRNISITFIAKPARATNLSEALWNLMEQVRGIEPPSTEWQSVVLAVILHLHGISIASAGSVRSKPVIYLSVREPTMESGPDYWIRTSDPLLVRQML